MCSSFESSSSDPFTSSPHFACLAFHVVFDRLSLFRVARHGTQSRAFRHTARVSWHQDASWPPTPSRVVSAWPAIVDVDVDNSAVQVIPGSHHHTQLTFRNSTAAENNVLYQTLGNAADDGDATVALEMRAGQISFHSDWILHGPEPAAVSRRV